MAKALIFGISGQDGAYLSQLLLDKGYAVAGTTRDTSEENLWRLTAVGVRGRVDLYRCDPCDFEQVGEVMRELQPDEVYIFCGQSSVGRSFAKPLVTLRSIVDSTSNILEAARRFHPSPKIYNACSSECFGNTPTPADEDTPFNPRSPYGTAKAASFWLVRNYREAFGLNCCSGILFNHESPLRSSDFVSAKIVRAAIAISEGRQDTLELGNVSSVRDWGWAPDYVDAMWRMLQQDHCEDYVVSSGESHSIEDFVATVFAEAGLDWTRHVTIDNSLFRPTDITASRGDSSKVREQLNWTPSKNFQQLAQSLLEGVEQPHTGG